MAKVVSVTYAGREDVFNMTVEKHHNYMIAGNIIVKNCDALRYFCQFRHMKPEMPVADSDDYDDFDTTDYGDAMTGGSADNTYILY